MVRNSKARPRCSGKLLRLRQNQRRRRTIRTNLSAKSWKCFSRKARTCLRHRPRRSGSRFLIPLQFSDVLKVLPPPSAWSELEKAVEARPAAEGGAKQKKELALRLIAHTLTRNTARRAEDLKALDAMAKKATGPEASYEFVSIFQTLNEAILATMDDPEAIL